MANQDAFEERAPAAFKWCMATVRGISPARASCLESKSS